MIPFPLDVHTHTVSSGHHTTDTVTDMTRTAKEKGLTLLGISEHGPALPHSCTLSYFRSLPLAPSVRMGIRILYGAEVNIVDLQGKLDLPDSAMAPLDYCRAGMHLPCLSPGTTDENTNAYIQAMINPYIRILAHADDPKFPVDYHRLILAAMEQHVILELNNNSLAPDGYRGNAKENSRQILTLCKKYHYPVLLSSDSHGHENIGNFQYALKLIEETNFPMELILNSSVTDFLSFLKK